MRRRLRSISMIRRSASTWVPTSWAAFRSETSTASGLWSFSSLRRTYSSKRTALVGEHLEHALVYGVLGEQAMHVDRADLAHAVAAGDGLVFDGGLPLRLGEDHHGGGLDVQPHSPGLDLAHQDRGPAASPNSSTMVCRWIGGVLPVSGPTATPPRTAATVLRTSRK